MNEAGRERLLSDLIHTEEVRTVVDRVHAEARRELAEAHEARRRILSDIIADEDTREFLESALPSVLPVGAVAQPGPRRIPRMLPWAAAVMVLLALYLAPSPDRAVPPTAGRVEAIVYTGPIYRIIHTPATSARTDWIVHSSKGHPLLEYIDEEEILGSISDTPVALVKSDGAIPRLYIQPSPGEAFVALN